MTIKKDLSALQKDINAIGKKLELLLKSVEKSESKPAKATAPKVKAKAAKAPKVKKAPAKKAPATKKSDAITATDQVLNIVKRSKKGVDTSTLMKKTGFNQKKVTNILHRSFKAGKIKRADKGIYVGVK